MSRIIFIDIDGPLIPVRACYLPGQTSIMSVFDPCAAAMLQQLIKLSDAKLVVSSTWGLQGYDKCMNVFTSNGFSKEMFHEDWVTPRKMSSARIHEISWWLDRHPETTHYVAIDDEQLSIDWVPNSVLCDAYEGFSWRNFLECQMFLDVFDGPDDPKRMHTADLITYFKRREIWRTSRRDEPNHHRVIMLADELFPRVPPNKDD